jgi:hypothetical protein
LLLTILARFGAVNNAVNGSHLATCAPLCFFHYSLDIHLLSINICTVENVKKAGRNQRFNNRRAGSASATLSVVKECLIASVAGMAGCRHHLSHGLSRTIANPFSSRLAVDSA